MQHKLQIFLELTLSFFKKKTYLDLVKDISKII